MEIDGKAEWLTDRLAGRAKNTAAKLAELAPLHGAKILLDIGGGTGIYSIAYLQKHPELRVILLDLPKVTEVASRYAEEYGVKERMECRSGDMFTCELPRGVDAILLSNILHDWDVPECCRLLKRCADALAPGGQLLIHDVLLNDELDGPEEIAIYSVVLFFLTKGRAYSAAEYREWLLKSGLVPQDRQHTGVHCWAVKAVKPLIPARVPLEHYRAFVDDVQVGIAICRRDNGEYIEVNRAFAGILGLTIEETLSRSYWEITPKKYEEAEHKQLERIEKDGLYGPYEKEYIHKDGHLIPVRLAGQVIDVGGVQHIWSIVEDLTNEKYRTLFLEAGLAFALCDMAGNLIDVNIEFANMLGYTIQELESMSYWNITPKGFHKQEAEQLDNLAKWRRYGPYNKEFIHRDNVTLVPVILSGLLINIGGTDFIWSIIERGEDFLMTDDDQKAPITDPGARDEKLQPIQSPRKPKAE
jgi:PAS domain S-box-containing protein